MKSYVHKKTCLRMFIPVNSIWKLEKMFIPALFIIAKNWIKPNRINVEYSCNQILLNNKREWTVTTWINPKNLCWAKEARRVDNYAIPFFNSRTGKKESAVLGINTDALCMGRDRGEKEDVTDGRYEQLSGMVEILCWQFVWAYNCQNSEFSIYISCKSSQFLKNVG